MIQKKTSPSTSPKKPGSTSKPSLKRESPPPVPYPVEITLSLGWILLFLGGLAVAVVSLLHQEPLILAIGRAVALMLLLGFLVYYLADGIMRTLLKARVPTTQQPTAENEGTPKSTRELSV